MDIIERIQKYRNYAREKWKEDDGDKEVYALIEKLQDQIIEREHFLEAVHEGIELAVADREEVVPQIFTQFNTTDMNEEKVNKTYLDYFNLAYSMTMERNPHYETLIDMGRHIPNFEKSDTYKALEAGKKQAEMDLEREMAKQYSQFKKSEMLGNGNNIFIEKYNGQDERDQAVRLKQEDEELDRQRETPEQQKAHFDAHEEQDRKFHEEFGRPRSPYIPLTPAQMKELEDWEAGEEDRRKKQAFKEATRQSLNQSIDLMNETSIPTDQKKQDEDEVDRMMREKEERQKNKDRHR